MPPPHVARTGGSNASERLGSVRACTISERYHTAALVVVEGPGQGAHYALVEPLVSIGRDDTCTVQVLDPQVSRKHLQIRLDPALGKHVAAELADANTAVAAAKKRDEWKRITLM